MRPHDVATAVNTRAAVRERPGELVRCRRGRRAVARPDGCDSTASALDPEAELERCDGRLLHG